MRGSARTDKGAVDAGKSSLLGVLVKGDLDDGRGKARVNLFRHKHEIETGRTSSVGMEIMGFDSKGNVITSDTPGRELCIFASVYHQQQTKLSRKTVMGGHWQTKRQGNHFHGPSRAREIPPNYSIRSTFQQSELLPLDGRSQ